MAYYECVFYVAPSTDHVALMIITMIMMSREVAANMYIIVIYICVYVRQNMARESRRRWSRRLPERLTQCIDQFMDDIFTLYSLINGICVPFCTFNYLHLFFRSYEMLRHSVASPLAKLIGSLSAIDSY